MRQTIQTGIKKMEIMTKSTHNNSRKQNPQLIPNLKHEQHDI